MVIIMYKSANTDNVMMYNEKKVNEGVTTLSHFKNTKSANPFNYDEHHRLKILLDIEEENPNTKYKTRKRNEGNASDRNADCLDSNNDTFGMGN